MESLLELNPLDVKLATCLDKMTASLMEGPRVKRLVLMCASARVNH